jgi:hypothetical protein
MDAVVIPDLFKGNQLEEMRYWLDSETPYNNDDTWFKKNTGHMVKMCPELNTLHTYTIDKAREVFDVHDLLPTFATLNWYEFDQQHPVHKDTDPVEYTIMYNYFSENTWKIDIGGHIIELGNEESVAYHGSKQNHSRLNNPGGITLALYLNYATPSSYHFILGEYSTGNAQFPSGRHFSEIEKDWL